MSSDVISSPAPSLSESEDNGGMWQERYKSLRMDYEKLEARIFALAQREYQITDDKITKKYRQIRDGLDIWIDGLQEDDRKDFRSIYQANLQKRGRKELFTDVGFRGDCLDERWEEELGRQETCIYVVLGMVIANFVKDLLSKAYPLGVRKSQKVFLKALSKSSTQTKDQAIFYRWRGETLSIIASTSDFAKHCKNECEIAFRDLKLDLSEWLSQRSLAKHEATLRELILQPAVDFHRMINCSGKKFETYNLHSIESPVPEIAMGWDLIDIVSWRVSRNTEIKGVFHCLLPALIMRASMDQTNVTFVTPVLLGYKTSSLDPSKTASSSPVRQDSTTTERATLGTRNLSGLRNPQPHISRSSTSRDQKSEPSASKDHKIESSASKEHKSESSFSRRLRRRLLGTRTEDRSDGGMNRRPSHPSRPPSPNARNTRQDSTVSSRHVHASPSDQVFQLDQSSPSGQSSSLDQTSPSDSETSTASATAAALERTDVRTETASAERGHDQQPSQSTMETWVAGTGAGSANVRSAFPGYVPPEEAARIAGITSVPQA